MSTRHSHSVSPYTPQVGAAFFHSLEVALMEQCADRYDAELTVSHGEIASTPGAEDVSFEIRGSDVPLLSVSVAVRFVGGNVYDLEIGPADEPTWTHTYTLSPSLRVLVTRMPERGEEAARFLLREMEHWVGRESSRHEKRSPNKDDSSTEQSRGRSWSARDRSASRRH